VVHQVEHLSRAQQRLGRDATPVEADPAQVLALDEADLHAQLRAADRGDVAAGAAADDDEVELMRHDLPRILNAVARREAQCRAGPGRFEFGETACRRDACRPIMVDFRGALVHGPGRAVGDRARSRPVLSIPTLPRRPS